MTLLCLLWMNIFFNVWHNLRTKRFLWKFGKSRWKLFKNLFYREKLCNKILLFCKHSVIIHTRCQFWSCLVVFRIGYYISRFIIDIKSIGYCREDNFESLIRVQLGTYLNYQLSNISCIWKVIGGLTYQLKNVSSI